MTTQRTSGIMTYLWPSHVRAERVWRELRDIGLALLMVAMTTVVAWALIRYFDLRRGSFIYLVPVLLAGWHLGRLPAMVAAVTGVLWSGYFFYAPFYNYFVARPAEILNFALFMAVALVAGPLAHSVKRANRPCRQPGKPISGISSFSPWAL